MAINLYGLAGAGHAGAGLNAASGIGQGLSMMGPMAMMSGKPAGMIGGGIATLGGLLTNIFTGSDRAARQEAAGKEMFGKAKTSYQQNLDKHPNYFTTASVDRAFNRARGDMIKSNQVNTNALLDRFSSVQRRQLQNRIRSGLSAGAAQASAIQNSLGFQQQANRNFQQQSQQLSQLGIREGQAKQNMQGQIMARKNIAARDALMGAGIVNPAAVGGLSAQLKGY